MSGDHAHSGYGFHANCPSCQRRSDYNYQVAKQAYDDAVWALVQASVKVAETLAAMEKVRKS